MLCFFTLNFPLKKAETKVISQMKSKLFSGISNKSWTRSLFISISLHISHWQCFYFLQHTLVTYPYQSVITFGGYRDDFMVVTSQQREPGVGKKTVEKLVFAMAKPKVCLLCLCSQAESSFPFASMRETVTCRFWWSNMALPTVVHYFCCCQGRCGKTAE